MKTFFETPAIEVIKFQVADVVTTSSEEEDFTMMPPCA